MSQVRKATKKPVTIEYVEFDGTPAGALDVFDAFAIPGGKFVPDYDLRTGTLLIPTLEGDHTASRGDMIIKGVKGEFYPCKPDIFALTYDLEPDGSQMTPIPPIPAYLKRWSPAARLEECGKPHGYMIGDKEGLWYFASAVDERIAKLTAEVALLESTITGIQETAGKQEELIERLERENTRLKAHQ